MTYFRMQRRSSATKARMISSVIIKNVGLKHFASREMQTFIKAKATEDMEASLIKAEELMQIRLFI